MRLPGGPSEAGRLRELYAQTAAIAEKVEALDSWRVERPTPSQYAAVAGEVARFVGSLGDTARIIALTADLVVCPHPPFSQGLFSGHLVCSVQFKLSDAQSGYFSQINNDRKYFAADYDCVRI